MEAIFRKLFENGVLPPHYVHAASIEYITFTVNEIHSKLRKLVASKNGERENKVLCAYSNRYLPLFTHFTRVSFTSLFSVTQSLSHLPQQNFLSPQLRCHCVCVRAIFRGKERVCVSSKPFGFFNIYDKTFIFEITFKSYFTIMFIRIFCLSVRLFNLFGNILCMFIAKQIHYN